MVHCLGPFLSTYKQTLSYLFTTKMSYFSTLCMQEQFQIFLSMRILVISFLCSGNYPGQPPRLVSFSTQCLSTSLSPTGNAGLNPGSAGNTVHGEIQDQLVSYLRKTSWELSEVICHKRVCSLTCTGRG